MKAVAITSAKLNVVFRPGELPSIDPTDPRFRLVLGKHVIEVAINAKAARKLAAHPSGAILQGRLAGEGDRLQLVEAGFQFVGKREEMQA
jgi:hypothetical protein